MSSDKFMYCRHISVIFNTAHSDKNTENSINNFDVKLGITSILKDN